MKRSIARAAQRAKSQDAKLRSKLDAIKNATNPKARARAIDSYQNFAAQLGLGTDTLFSGGTYGFNPITRQRTLLEWIHRGSWLGGVAIDIFAADMTRAGVDIVGDMEPDDIEHLERAAVTYEIWPRIEETYKWARLYGGAICVPIIDGQKPDTPLRPEAIGKGAFKGLQVFDRWMIEPTLTDLVTEPGPHIGLPKYYIVTADAPALQRQKIHYSRCLRLEGIRLPYWQRMMENMWGISVFERLYDRMLAFDSATTGAAQLVYKSYLRTYRIDGLRELISAGGDMMNGLLAYIDMMRRMQSTEGITLLDMKDEFATFQHSAFGGLAEVMLQMGQQISGSLQMPLVRLFGQSPAGLNATGDADLRTYYDGIAKEQNTHLKGPVTTIYMVLAKSEGVNVPEGFGIQFRPLWQLTDGEKATIASADVQTVGGAFDMGVIDVPTAMEELQQLSRITGRFTNITREMIEQAREAQLPPELEEAMLSAANPETSTATEMLLGPSPKKQLSLPPARRTGDQRRGSGGQSSAAAGERGGSEGIAAPEEPPHVVAMRQQLESLETEFRARNPEANTKRVLKYLVEKVKGGKAKDKILGDRKVMGLNVVIEQERGEERYGARLPAAYGFIRRTDSAERNNQMDIFVLHEEGPIFVIDAYDERGEFDEHKVMVGWPDKATALKDFRAYYSGFAGGPDRRVGITEEEISIDELKSWLENGDMSKPFYKPPDVEYVSNAKNPKESCARCFFFETGVCTNHRVHHDPKVPEGFDGSKIVAASGWCTEWEAK